MDTDDRQTPPAPLPDAPPRPFSGDAWTVFIIGIALLLLLKMV